MSKAKLVWAICGSFCTIRNNVEIMERAAEEFELIPVISEQTASTDTRFGNAADLIADVTEICRRPPILTIKDAEPIGPTMKPDLCVIAPATGNTTAKIANGITDSAVTMAAKSTLRCGKPILLSIATNDALGANLRNIGELTVRKYHYFVPMKQDDPIGKPTSLVADTARLYDAIHAALNGVQLRPIFL